MVKEERIEKVRNVNLKSWLPAQEKLEIYKEEKNTTPKTSKKATNKQVAPSYQVDHQDA